MNWADATPRKIVANTEMVAEIDDGEIDEVAVIQTSADRISELIATSDLQTPVSHLGRWKVRDVAAHLGGVHRWATRIVIGRSMDGPGFVKSKLDGSDLCDWFQTGVEELLEAFERNHRHEPCPNFNPGSTNTVAWWLRRQMHETTVHRWDIEQALGCTTSIDETVAADGIDEFLDVFVRTRGKQTLASSLVLSTDLPQRSWTLTPAEKPGRIDISANRSPADETEVLGPADQLLLALWHRLPLGVTDLRTTGDMRAIESLMDS